MKGTYKHFIENFYNKYPQWDNYYEQRKLWKDSLKNIKQIKSFTVNMKTGERTYYE